MPAIQLHIKGNHEQAEKQLLERGFHPSERLTHPVSYTPGGMPADYVVTDVTVKAECEPGVVRWFFETASNKTGPFQPGTLLHYTVTLKPGKCVP